MESVSEFGLSSKMKDFLCQFIFHATSLNCLRELQCFLFCIFFGGLECVGHSFAYVAHFVFLGDVWLRTQRELP
jgi:hypothetical protein